MLKNKAYILLAAVAFAIFLVGIVQLLLLRFSSGDVYPHYSSLRSDPFGTKALYESLDGCCGLNVSRNYEPFSNIKNRTNAVLIFPGAIPPYQDQLPESFIKDIESFLNNGGRMVVTYTSGMDISSLWKVVQEEQEREEAENRKDKKKKKEKEKDKEEAEEKSGDRLISFGDRWGLNYKNYPLEGADESKLAAGAAGARLPQSVHWGSELYFDDLDSSWKVIYEREGHAVMIERQMSKGTVILASDSYFLSNEAMVRSRHPELIAWLVGDRKEIVFDEYFHGIATSPGVATLARRYRLHGVVAGILALVALFIWKNSLSFVPPHPDAPANARTGALAEGKDSTAGLTNLLRRSIPLRDVLSVCYQEWRKSHAQTAIRKSNQLERIDSIYKSAKSGSFKQRDAVRAYNEISAVLKEK